MDLTAATMARDNNINLVVFDIKKDDALLKAITGENLQTKVTK